MLSYNTIQKLVKKNGLTIKQFSEKLGNSEGWWYQAKRENTDMMFSTVLKMAKILNVKIDELLYIENQTQVAESDVEYSKNCSNCQRFIKEIAHQQDHIDLLLEQLGRKKNTSHG